MSKCMNESMSSGMNSEMNMSSEMNSEMSMNMSMNMNREMKTICTDCAHTSSCTKQFDKNECKSCPLVEDHEPLRYRNSEGYPDPTAYFALRNVMRKPHGGTKGRSKPHGGQQHKTKKRRPRTQVVYYD